ncbi:hypothetical protein, partial [Oenococcus oeni]|uniref:hypothetical protein n=1 Tax=Oenococcus oeni TaxID=1247 RepID=UPI001C5B2023
MGADRYTTWEATLNVIKQTRQVLLVGAKPEWKNVFNNIDVAINKEPHTVETIKKVAEGLAKGNALTPEQLAAIPETLRGRDGVEQIN